MNFLKEERQTLNRLLPGLDDELACIPLEELERAGSPSLEIYRSHRGPALVVPIELGGLGVSPLEAVQVHRALGSRSPSLALATTMHDYTVATLAIYNVFGERGRRLLSDIASQGDLLASGFAEGQPGQSIRCSRIRAVPTASGFLLTGSKKPCSLSRSMRWLFASVALSEPEAGEPRFAVALVSAKSPGLERKPFWRNWVLAGAESDEVSLDEVFVPQDMFYVVTSDDQHLDRAEIGGTVWFELLVTASYLGVASTLVERALAGRKGRSADRMSIAADLESAMAALEGVARAFAAEGPSDAALARSLLVRFATQQAIQRATGEAAELLGGMAFIGDGEVSYLLAASRALVFHPPSRLSIADSLSDYLAGASMQLV